MFPDGIHPLIRVCSFLVFAVVVSHADIARLSLALLSLGVLYYFAGKRCLIMAGRLIYRIRWIFLSLLMVYAWFGPGNMAVDSVASWLPSLDGLTTGIQQGLSLALIILAVNLLLRFTEKSDLLLALRCLVRPLSFVGVSRDRVALRMLLVIDAVPRVQILLGKALDEIRGRRFTLTNIAVVTADVFKHVIVRADQEPAHSIALTPLSPPPLWQWLYPLLLGAVFLIPI